MSHIHDQIHERSPELTSYLLEDAHLKISAVLVNTFYFGGLINQVKLTLLQCVHTSHRPNCFLEIEPFWWPQLNY